MRIFSRSAFMELPEGVLFIQGAPHCFGNELCRKGETIRDGQRAIDWFYSRLSSIEHHDSLELHERFDAMLDSGARFALDAETEQRDGAFEDSDLFLVYEREDLAQLARIVQGAAVPP